MVNCSHKGKDRNSDYEEGLCLVTDEAFCKKCGWVADLNSFHDDVCTETCFTRGVILMNRVKLEIQDLESNKEFHITPWYEASLTMEVKPKSIKFYDRGGELWAEFNLAGNTEKVNKWNFS